MSGAQGGIVQYTVKPNKCYRKISHSATRANFVGEHSHFLIASQAASHTAGTLCEMPIEIFCKYALHKNCKYCILNVCFKE
jgi:hypothetical protein